MPAFLIRTPRRQTGKARLFPDRSYAQMFDGVLPERTYALFLDDRKLRWRTSRYGETVGLQKEPETTWGQRFLAKSIGRISLDKQQPYRLGATHGPTRSG
jgi:hypothetical protein